MPLPYQAVRKLPANQVGRDFVVGDIHGCYDLLVAVLRKARFDPDTDRLFAVGDLIDRGPGSHRCAAFLAQPYVHAVRGNHEDMLLSLYAEGDPGEDALAVMCRFNGMDWWRDVAQTLRSEILAALSGLPLALEVETRRGTVGLIHADVPRGMDWPSFLARLEAGDHHTVQTCLWGRSRIEHRDESGVSGVGRIFVGHTPQWGGVARYGNVFAIDTGGVFGEMGDHPQGHLTLGQLAMQTGVLLAPRRHSPSLVELKDDAAESPLPFGVYLDAAC